MIKKLVGLIIIAGFMLGLAGTAEATQFLDTPVDKSLSTTSSWQDIDLSSNVPSGAKGAIFQMINKDSSNGDKYWGLRKKGSTNDIKPSIYYGNAHHFAVIGLDENRKCQGYISSTYVDLYLIGYVEDDGGFFTNSYDKSIATSGTWTDITCSEVPDGTIAAIFEVYNPTSSLYDFGLRKKGSSDNRYDSIDWPAGTFFIVGLDANKKCQGYVQNTAVKFYLIGYLTKGEALTNGIDRSISTTGSYIDITESGAPANATGVFGEVQTSTFHSVRKIAFRKNGATYDYYYYDSSEKIGFFVGLDSNKMWEGKIIDPIMDFYVLGYFVHISAPTVTTSACTSVATTSATDNGNITNTGGENCTTRGFCYMTDTSGDPTTANSTAYDTGSFGTGAYTKSITGLSSGTSYRVRAYAINSGGTGYGTTVQLLTLPAAPTNVAATDGAHTDKVVITWTKSTGATDYHVWRDAVDLGAAGDVAAFDDTGADAPTITPGTAAASDGTSSAHVALSLSGQSANNGTTHTYKVVASNATGNSADSTTDNGYRGVGALTYQWQRSAADSDASYSNISGATTASYNDTGAPADGSGRHYKCVEDAADASQQTSTADRGYRAIGVSTITISAATSVEETTARLNGNVTDVGGENPTVTVYWGTADGGQTPGSWTNSSAPTSPGQPQGIAAFYRDATVLGSGTLYYFSAKAANSGGDAWPAASLSFTTKPNPPTSLSASTISQTQIDVSWTKGSGAEKTMVRRKVDSYPSSVSDGDEAYFDTGSSFNDTGLTCGTHYYYRAWSYKTGAPSSGYSDSYAEDNAATSSCNTGPTAPTEIKCEGETNPTGVTDTTPEFSAIYNDPDPGDTSNAYEIQVGTTSDPINSPDMWDSGWLADSTTESQRCSDKSYAGSALSWGTKYYWAIRFRDTGGEEGAWSSVANFTMLSAGGLTISAGDNNPAAETILNNATNEEMIQLKLTAGSSEGINISSITFTSSGTGDEANDITASSVKLYNDINNNGAFDSGTDTQIGTDQSWSGDNGTVTFSGLSESISQSSSENWILICSFAGGIDDGKTFQVSLVNNSDITGIGAITAQSITPSGAAVAGGVKTIGSVSGAPTITVPGNGKTLGTEITVIGTAPAGSTVTIKDQNGNTVGTTTADSEGNYRLSLSALSAGTNELTPYAGETAGSSRSVTIVSSPTRCRRLAHLLMERI